MIAAGMVAAVDGATYGAAPGAIGRSTSSRFGRQRQTEYCVSRGPHTKAHVDWTCEPANDALGATDVIGLAGLGWPFRPAPGGGTRTGSPMMPAYSAADRDHTSGDRLAGLAQLAMERIGRARPAQGRERANVSTSGRAKSICPGYERAALDEPCSFGALPFTTGPERQDRTDCSPADEICPAAWAEQQRTELATATTVRVLLACRTPWPPASDPSPSLHSIMKRPPASRQPVTPGPRALPCATIT